MKIKICGLTRLEDIKVVNQVQPDYIGFVFAKSRRQVNVQQAQLLKNQLDHKIKAVGVFVNDDIDRICHIVNKHIIDIIQLHGDEDETYIKQLKSKVDCPIIKAIKIKSKEDIQNHIFNVDYYLLDGMKPGSGETFDWSFIHKMNKPFFLAGGINLHNIDDALKMDCYGIDVSSGVETDGYKDPIKIEEMVRRVKNECR